MKISKSNLFFHPAKLIFINLAREKNSRKYNKIILRHSRIQLKNIIAEAHKTI